MRTPRQILEESTTIAVVGASRHEDKSAYSVPLQMRLHGWRVIPVNPYAEEIWGERSYPSLADVPGPIDLVNVFRPSEQATEVVRQAIAVGAGAVWLQQGIVSAEGRRLAEDAGIDYVEDHCIAVERALSRLSRRG
ncbi:MAG: CoA-binding protein [Micromonosporaceae bacterium]